MQRNVGIDTFHHGFTQSGTHPRQCLLTGIPVNNDFPDHRIVVRRHEIIGVNMRIHPNARAAWRMPHGDAARRGREFVRVFSVHTALNGVPANLYLALRERQLFARSHHDLGFDNVNTRHHLCDGVLHLHAGVHLDKVELTVFIQKLKRTGPPVIDFFARSHTTLAHPLNQLAGDTRRRRFFKNFLVPTLHGAITLTQINRILVLVSQNLNLDMPRVLEKFLQIHRRITKCSTGFSLGHGHGIDQGRFGVHHAHTASTAAACRLDDDGVADRLGDAPNLGRIVWQFAFRTRHARHTRFDHGLLGRYLVAHDANRLGRWANELEATFFNALGKIGVFTQKTVTGVNGLGIGDLCCRNDGGHIQVAQGGRRWPDAHRLFG